MSATRSSPVDRLPGAMTVAELRGVKGDGDVRLGRNALDLAGRAVHARGDVGRDDRRTARVHRFDRLLRRRARGAVESGAEDRVDDAARAFEGAVRSPRSQPRGRDRGGASGSRPRRRRALRPARAEESPPRSPYRRGVARRRARRRRCCPCRRRSRTGPGLATSRTAWATASPAVSMSWSEGMPRSSIASESAARMLSAS